MPALMGGGGALGTASFLPSLLGAAPKLAGMFGAGGGTGGMGAVPAALPNPFAGIVNPQQVAPPPPPPMDKSPILQGALEAAKRAPADPAALAKMPAFGSPVHGDLPGPGSTHPKPPAAPAAVSHTARPMFDSDLIGPGSRHTKTVEFENGVPSMITRGTVTPSRMAELEALAGVGQGNSMNPYKEVFPEKTPSTTPAAMTSAPPAAPPRSPAPVETAQANAPQSGPLGKLFPAANGPMASIRNTLRNSATDPLFQTGLGLLASGYDSRVNPYTAIGKNLAGINPALLAQQNMNMKQAKQSAEMKKLESEKELAAALAALGLQQQRPQQEEKPATSQVAKRRASVIRR
ncbi:MAG: hypothetical protein P8Y36_00435 [Alphaproteobacteria bacterium]